MNYFYRLRRTEYGMWVLWWLTYFRILKKYHHLKLMLTIVADGSSTISQYLKTVDLKKGVITGRSSSENFIWSLCLELWSSFSEFVYLFGIFPDLLVSKWNLLLNHVLIPWTDLMDYRCNNFILPNSGLAWLCWMGFML